MNALVIERDVQTPLECTNICMSLPFSCFCRSINLGNKEKNGKVKCQISNNTMSEKQKDLIRDPLFDYWKPVGVSVHVQSLLPIIEHLINSQSVDWSKPIT